VIAGTWCCFLPQHIPSARRLADPEALDEADCQQHPISTTNLAEFDIDKITSLNRTS
jgi:hypothetical protein